LQQLQRRPRLVVAAELATLAAAEPAVASFVEHIMQEGQGHRA
jgi:hypothetical protein